MRGLLVASHPLPAAAVTAILTMFAWNIGWSGGGLLLVMLAVGAGQLSVGWSNDAFDAAIDARAHRHEKPTVAGAVSPSALWGAATVAVVLACALSWLAAGWGAGSFHVLALAMAWLYNVALSRTAWSWLPFAVAFGAMPLFLYVGLTGHPGPVWTVAVFALLAVAGHLANALRDLESDRGAGLGGVVVHLGARRSAMLCWLLLAIGTAVLVAVVATAGSPWAAGMLLAAFAGALAYGTLSGSRASMFHALIAVAIVDVAVLAVAPVFSARSS